MLDVKKDTSLYMLDNRGGQRSIFSHCLLAAKGQEVVFTWGFVFWVILTLLLLINEHFPKFWPKKEVLSSLREQYARILI